MCHPAHPNPLAIIIKREFDLHERILQEQGMDLDWPSTNHYVLWAAAVQYGYASEDELAEAARVWGDRFRYPED
jgi:hypothetical protein